MKRTIAFAQLIILSLFLFFSNRSVAQEKIRMQVKENRGICTGVGLMKCLQIKFKHSKDWEFFYDEIVGFNYQEGYRYELLVNKTKRKNVPADASSYTYELVRVVKQQKKEMPKDASPSIIDFLAKYNWRLIQLNGKLIESSPVYIIFDKNKRTVSGNSGCNTFFGPFKIEDDKISFAKLAGTLMACAEMNKLEAEFLSILRNDDLRFDIADQTFNIYKDNKLVIVFGLASL